MNERARLLNLKLALTIGIIVSGLSFFHRFSFLKIILRGIFSFLIIYVTGIILLYLWDKCSPDEDLSTSHENASTIDFRVGEEDIEEDITADKKSKSLKTDEQNNHQNMSQEMAGQINLASFNNSTNPLGEEPGE